ncbi:hypothetical protein PARMER_04333 [Parabacteroides merdae ATCC 43184]|nr:hypothetical protein PARMER_04333 [Parabacteroides merdae ATCC 43184]
MRNQKDDMKELVWRILVLLFHFEKVHRKTSFLNRQPVRYTRTKCFTL